MLYFTQNLFKRSLHAMWQCGRGADNTSWLVTCMWHWLDLCIQWNTEMNQGGVVLWWFNEILGGSENKLHAVDPGPKISPDMLYHVLDLLWTTNHACVKCLLQFITAAIFSHCHQILVGIVLPYFVLHNTYWPRSMSAFRPHWKSAHVCRSPFSFEEYWNTALWSVLLFNHWWWCKPSQSSNHVECTKEQCSKKHCK